MPVNLSIKNAPDEVVRRLKERAARNHRSLQGELLAMVEEAVLEPPQLSIADVYKQNRAMGLRTPDESVQMIREDRDR